MAAADVTIPDLPVFCRVFELTVEGIDATADAETQLYWGIGPDEIHFDGRTITLERSAGDPDEFRVQLKLDPSRTGRYFDCEILEGQSTEQITAAVDELIGRGEVIWFDLWDNPL